VRARRPAATLRMRACGAVLVVCARASGHVVRRLALGGSARRAMPGSAVVSSALGSAASTARGSCLAARAARVRWPHARARGSPEAAFRRWLAVLLPMSGGSGGRALFATLPLRESR